MLSILKKTTNIHNEIHDEYIEAGKKIIINREYIPDLEKLLREGNHNNIEAVSQGYLPTDILLSFVIDTENKINKCLEENNIEGAEEMKKKYGELNLFEGRDELLQLVENKLNKKK